MVNVRTRTSQRWSEAAPHASVLSSLAATYRTSTKGILHPSVIIGLVKCRLVPVSSSCILIAVPYTVPYDKLPPSQFTRDGLWSAS